MLRSLKTRVVISDDVTKLHCFSFACSCVILRRDVGVSENTENHLGSTRRQPAHVPFKTITTTLLFGQVPRFKIETKEYNSIFHSNNKKIIFGTPEIRKMDQSEVDGIQV